jgi:hypothetical protein
MPDPRSIAPGSAAVAQRLHDMFAREERRIRAAQNEAAPTKCDPPGPGFGVGQSQYRPAHCSGPAPPSPVLSHGLLDVDDRAFAIAHELEELWLAIVYGTAAAGWRWWAEHDFRVWHHPQEL